MFGGKEAGLNLHHGKSELQAKCRVWRTDSNSNWVPGTQGRRAQLEDLGTRGNRVLQKWAQAQVCMTGREILSRWPMVGEEKTWPVPESRVEACPRVRLGPPHPPASVSTAFLLPHADQLRAARCCPPVVPSLLYQIINKTAGAVHVNILAACRGPEGRGLLLKGLVSPSPL